MTDTHNLLFALLRHALWQSPIATDDFNRLTDSEWKRLYKLASRHGVLAIVHDALAALPAETKPSRELQIAWIFNTEAIERHYNGQFAAAEKLFELSHAEGLDPVLLKGIALSRFYPTPEHRSCGDIDIYLGEQGEKLNTIMRAQRVDVDSKKNVKHAEFAFLSAHIENHATFVDTELYTIDRTLESYLIQKRTSAEKRTWRSLTYSVLPPTADALFLLRHSARHLEGGISIRHICDWAIFVKHHSKLIDWGEFMHMVKQLKLERFFDVKNGIACDYLGLDPKLLPPLNKRVKLQSKTLSFIMQYGEHKIDTSNPFNIIWLKYNRMMRRRWIIEDVLQGSFAGHIWRSVLTHMKHPRTLLVK